MRILGLVLGSLCIVPLAVLDDRHRLGPWPQLLGQVVIAAEHIDAEVIGLDQGDVIEQGADAVLKLRRKVIELLPAQTGNHGCRSITRFFQRPEPTAVLVIPRRHRRDGPLLDGGHGCPRSNPEPA